MNGREKGKRADDLERNFEAVFEGSFAELGDEILFLFFRRDSKNFWERFLIEME